MVKRIPKYKFYCFGHGEEFKEDNVEFYSILDTISKPPRYFEENMYIDMGKIIQILSNNIEKIDAVHVFDWMYIPLGICLKKFLNCKLMHTFALSASKQIEIVYNFHNKPKKFLDNNREHIDIVNKYEGVICDKADKIIHVSNHMQSLFDSKYKDKSKVIYNGVDFDYYGKEVNKTKYIMPGSPSKKKVMYMGRFVGMKNIYNLLSIKVPEGVEMLVAAGQIGNFPWIVETMWNKPPEGFTYIGFISGEIKNYLLQNVDAVIVPSVHEPFGLVTLETIASKTLLICSRASGMEEYIHEDMCINCGLTVKSIEEALKRFLEMNETDKQTLIDTAYRKTKHLTWERNAYEYSKVYDSI